MPPTFPFPPSPQRSSPLILGLLAAGCVAPHLQGLRALKVSRGFLVGQHEEQAFRP